MAAKLKQSLQMKQGLRMTPQLQQAIKLLQLSRVELEAEVRKELEENPILEEGIVVANSEVVKKEEVADVAVQDPQKQDEFDWEAYVENQNKRNSLVRTGSNDVANYENMVSNSESLHDNLYWQASLFGFNEEELNIANILISYIEDDGYIKVDFDTISKEHDIPTNEFLEIIPFIHEFEPAGVGARNLKECLMIQAKHMEEDTHDLMYILDNHLSDLEKRNYKAIAKASNIDLDTVIDICGIILSMDPKPGRSMAISETRYVTPDVYVYKVADEYMISLNEDGLPKLRISNLYKQYIKKDKQDAKAKEYVQEKLKSALWLIKSIHQRQRTIYKVTESIVKHQRVFFDKGPNFLKPMILKDIANDIGMHESTVSRVTNSKYVHTPRGIFELKYFFNSGISNSGGEDMASESVKVLIKKYVSEEDPKKPLSDQKLVLLLKEKGIKIARRTVAKYREALKIMPSSKRKRYY